LWSNQEHICIMTLGNFPDLGLTTPAKVILMLTFVTDLVDFDTTNFPPISRNPS
jgi:hypothetical protein